MIILLWMGINLLGNGMERNDTTGWRQHRSHMYTQLWSLRKHLPFFLYITFNKIIVHYLSKIKQVNFVQQKTIDLLISKTHYGFKYEYIMSICICTLYIP